jgi:hypothetical protein
MMGQLWDYVREGSLVWRNMATFAGDMLPLRQWSAHSPLAAVLYPGFEGRNPLGMDSDQSSVTLTLVSQRGVHSLTTQSHTAHLD